MDCREDKNRVGMPDIEKEKRMAGVEENELTVKGLKFEEDFGEFLAKLKDMPLRKEEGKEEGKVKYKKEDKEARWNYFQSYLKRDEFIHRLWGANHPHVLEALEKRLSGQYTITLEQNAGIASIKNRNEIDTVIFQEAIKQAIETYTGRTQNGDNYRFVACVGQLYKQMAGKEASKNAWEEKEAITRSAWKRRQLGGFIKAVNETYERLHPYESKNYVSVREAAEIVKANSTKCSITDADMDYVINRVLGKSYKIFLEEKIDEDQDLTWGDVIADESGEKYDYHAVMGRIVPFLKDLENNWEDLKAFKDLNERMICKMFLTKDVLQVLKTDEEGKPYTEEPAGNKDAGNEAAYRQFKPQGRFLYEKVFYVKYLCRAFAEKPMDFYETYVKVLRKDFNFSDDLLAEIEGKNRTTIWRNRKKYKKTMEFFWWE